VLLEFDEQQLLGALTADQTERVAVRQLSADCASGRSGARLCWLGGH
jgi:hypothetical protein